MKNYLEIAANVRRYGGTENMIRMMSTSELRELIHQHEDEIERLRNGLIEIADKIDKIPANDPAQHDALVAVAMKANALAYHHRNDVGCAPSSNFYPIKA